VTDHEHILQRKVRTEIMLRTSSRFDFKKNKKNPQKMATDRSIDLLRISTKTGLYFPKKERNEKRRRRAGACEDEGQSTNATSERELEGKGVGREGERRTRQRAPRTKGGWGRGWEGGFQGVNNFSIIKIIVIIGR
jgi:hypothetical protein